MSCDSCKHEKSEVGPVPYIVHEGEMARNERRERRLLFALILSVTLLFASNAFWLYEWTQYDYASEEVTTTYTQDGEGVNVIGDGNEVIPNGAK